MKYAFVRTYSAGVCEVTRVELLQAIEILDVTESARKNIEKAQDPEPVAAMATAKAKTSISQ